MTAILLEQYILYAGVGNHIIFMLEFKSAIITGDKLPKNATPATRCLISNSDRIRKLYNKVLEELCDRHIMFEKILLVQGIPSDGEDAFIKEMNK